MSEAASRHCSSSRVNKEGEVTARRGGSGQPHQQQQQQQKALQQRPPHQQPQPKKTHREVPKGGSREKGPEVAPEIDGNKIVNAGKSGKVLSRHVSNHDLPDGSEEVPSVDLEAGQDKYTRKMPLAACQEKAHKKQRVEEPAALTEGVSPLEAIRKNVDNIFCGISDDDFALLEEEMMMAEEDKTDALLFSPPEAEDKVNVKVPLERVPLVNQLIKGMHTPLAEFAAGSSSSGRVRPCMIVPLFGRVMYEVDRRLNQAVVMFGAAMQSKRYYDGLTKDVKAVVTERDTLRKALQEKVTDLEKEKANADELWEEIVRLEEENAKLSEEKVGAKSLLRAALAQLDA